MHRTAALLPLLVVLAAACASPAATSEPVAVETVTEVVTETVADAGEVSATAEPTALPSCEGALPSQECVEPDPIDDAEPESDPGSDCEGVPDELCDADFSDVVPVEPATCGPAEYAAMDALAAESQRLQSALFDIPAPYSSGVTGPSTGQDYTDLRQPAAIPHRNADGPQRREERHRPAARRTAAGMCKL